MKEQLLDIVRGSENPVLAGNLAREHLQARILLALQEAGAMIPLAFQGGTALRFLFGLPRFSVDLDFALGLDFLRLFIPPTSPFRRCSTASTKTSQPKGVCGTATSPGRHRPAP